MLKHLVCEIDGYVLHLYAEEAVTDRLVNEAARGKGEPLGGVYYFRKHAPHVAPGQTHLHVYMTQNELFALNWDGSAHDQSHGVRIPNQVYRALQTRFPALGLPTDRVIECIDPLALGVILETFTKAGMSVEEMIDLQVLLTEAREAS